MKQLFLSLMLGLLIASACQADTRPNDAEALQGINEGKAIFDINMADAKKLTLYLMVIDETVEDLKRQGVKPDVILAFRGLSVKLISKDREQLDLEDFEHLDKIAAQLAALQQKGVRMQACSVATRLFRVDNGQLLDGITPVGNTFVSLTGYQAQGYANIPIY